MRHDSWQPFLIPSEQELSSFYCRLTMLPNTRNWGTGVWGIYFDETSRAEQTSGSRVLRTGISCKSLVVGEQEQKYSARPRIRHPRGRSPVKSIKPFLLRVEVRRPGQRQLARRALQPENQGTKAMQPPTITETEHPLSRGGRITGVNGGKVWMQERPIKR